uniref:Uncharacterized protein n=1 Tax=Arundo donax TaxID=35708 RepID=A0A0A8XNC5_ARUDO
MAIQMVRRYSENPVARDRPQKRTLGARVSLLTRSTDDRSVSTINKAKGTRICKNSVTGSRDEGRPTAHGGGWRGDHGASPRQINSPARLNTPKEDQAIDGSDRNAFPDMEKEGSGSPAPPATLGAGAGRIRSGHLEPLSSASKHATAGRRRRWGLRRRRRV